MKYHATFYDVDTEIESGEFVNWAGIEARLLELNRGDDYAHVVVSILEDAHD